jgi:uncharacterized protein YxeA
MQKKLRIILKLLVFAIIAGFVWYMVNSHGKRESFFGSDAVNGQDDGISPYRKTNTIQAKSDIIAFDLSDDNIYIAVNHAVTIYDKEGTFVRQIPIGKEIRDIIVEDGRIYLLYPAGIEVFTPEGDKVAGWEAHSNQSDYCAFTTTKDYIFVTDAGNKHIYQYDKQGWIVRFFASPAGFIIPSYSFGIVSINDTIYCSNSGRHKIESYTVDGEFIASFGVSGAQAGAFAGCCNPVYLAATRWGDILTSEKGNPRISCYSRDGKFRTILLNSKILGGGTQAYYVKMQDDKIYVAGKKTLSVFVFDAELAEQSACADCPSDCPLRKGIN